MLSRRINVATAIAYWIAQYAAAAAAAYLLKYLIGAGSGLGATIEQLTPVVAGQGDAIKIIIVEAILTVFLITSVFASGSYARNGNVAGIAIGLVLTMDILAGAPLTGASMNPARTFGPALALGNLSYFWLYVVGPFIGAIVGWLVCDQFFKSGKPGA